MSVLDTFYASIINFFMKKEAKVNPLIEKLKSKGFEFDEQRNGWTRTWTTNNEQEKCLEIYQQDEDNNWKVIMIGDKGDVFYEHPIEAN